MDEYDVVQFVQRIIRERRLQVLEVLENMEEDLKSFMLQTAFLEMFCYFFDVFYRLCFSSRFGIDSGVVLLCFCNAF